MAERRFPKVFDIQDVSMEMNLDNLVEVPNITIHDGKGHTKRLPVTVTEEFDSHDLVTQEEFFRRRAWDKYAK